MELLREMSVKLAVIALISLGGNFIATGTSPLQALPGMALLLAIVLAGAGVGRLVNIKSIPVIIFISLAGIVSTASFLPWSRFTVPLIDSVSISSLATPVLCIAGISTADEMKRITSMGIRMCVVAVAVLSGTFIFSAVIAEIIIRMLHL